MADEQKTHVLISPLEEIMGDRFGRYSKYIIQDRALPDARDGLKPVQRRILYTMQIDGNTHDKPYRKSVKSVGLVIGNFHPHGDSSVYDAMVRMSQNWKTREPLIDMHGNNGSMDDDPPAAMRYTEARLAPLAQYLLQDIDKNTVEFTPNFDDTNMEPTVLPARYPNLLVNGISGIAAGYATNIPPHNLGEVIDAAIYRLQVPDCELDELMEYIQGPDFPTGGIVQGIEGIKDAFTTGHGKIVVRAKVEINQTKTGQQIIVKELPYEVIKCNLVRKIDDIRLNKKIDGIIDVRDESDRNGLRVAIDLKKEANAELILNYLYKNTDLQVSYNYNVVAIVNKRPMQLGLTQMLDAFINHRIDVITRRCKFELDRMEKRCHILEGLIKAVSVLDEIIALIRSSKDKADSKKRIIERFEFTEEQAEAIVTLRLYRLSSTDVNELRDEFSHLVNEMEILNDMLAYPKLMRKEIVRELKEVKKAFGSPRLTKIENEIQEIVIDKQQMIPNERVMVTISRDGYVKRVSLRSYSASEHLSTGLKDGDELIGYKEVNMLDTLLYITSSGAYGYTPVYEIEEAKWKDIGSHLNTMVSISSEEKVIASFVLSSFDTNASIITLSLQGMIKRTMVKDLMVSRNNKTMNLMGLKAEDRVVAACVVYDNADLVVCSANGFVSRYNVNNITPTGARSKGIIAMKAEAMASLCALNNNENYVVIYCENQSIKRLKTSDLPLTGRPVRGESICKKVKSNPSVIKMIASGDLNDAIDFMKEKIEPVLFKDIALMSKDATFSSALHLEADSYPLKGIQTVEIREFSETEPLEDNLEVEQEAFDLN